ncbi:hypothetical protein PPL_11170 [Heterostelium album PN500]|uniref:Uncharacterized protein n=1 Tax=Heterostelium pallidum (strain ATCC 26659 / Pp 5 / PN500) TaxID=670386 RepID=D3BTR0_HETP5|nr:hypothetical protein PPL_11170 [Heterostelium album PN500]EFA75096.1 hypothetical protein PPL_11170 [Heterostelium album PN500]|eukprot:XP_020427230.1 hypothetical protein PPL_11170 [Heterostelium album PN500]
MRIDSTGAQPTILSCAEVNFTSISLTSGKYLQQYYTEKSHLINAMLKCSGNDYYVLESQSELYPGQYNISILNDEVSFYQTITNKFLHLDKVILINFEMATQSQNSFTMASSSSLFKPINNFNASPKKLNPLMSTINNHSINVMNNKNNYNNNNNNTVQNNNYNNNNNSNNNDVIDFQQRIMIPINLEFKLINETEFSCIDPKNEAIKRIFLQIEGAKQFDENWWVIPVLQHNKFCEMLMRTGGVKVKPLPRHILLAFSQPPKLVQPDYSRLPANLLNTLLPFQRKGIEFGISRDGNLKEDTLKVNSFIDNIVRGTFDIVVKDYDPNTPDDFQLVVWLKINQMTNEQKIFEVKLLFIDKEITRLKVNVPFIAPLTDDNIIRLVVKSDKLFIKYDIYLYRDQVDGLLKIESYCSKLARLQSKVGFGAYIYRNDIESDYSRWIALDSYSIESHIQRYNSHSCSYGENNMISHSFASGEKSYIPSLEDFAEVICHLALKMNGVSVGVSYLDQNGDRKEINVLGNEIGDFDTHQMLDILKLGFEHWFDLVNHDDDSSLEVSRLNYVLDTRQFTVNSSHSSNAFNAIPISLSFQHIIDKYLLEEMELWFKKKKDQL